MNVDKAKEVCHDRIKCLSLLSTYPTNSRDDIMFLDNKNIENIFLKTRLKFNHINNLQINNSK